MGECGTGERYRRARVRVQVAFVVVLLSGGGLTAADGPQHASGVSSGAADRFSGALTIRHRRIDVEGRPVGPSAPAIVLRVDRRNDRGIWKTTLSLLDSEPVRVQSLIGPQSMVNPFALARLEYDEDGTAPRLYNRAGSLVTGPTEADRQWLAVPESLRSQQWKPESILAAIGGRLGAPGARGAADGLVVAAYGRELRRADVERRFGPAVGVVRGLDRFITNAPGAVQELLLDRGTALPVEVSVARQGRLVSRTTFDYQPVAGDQFIRRLLRTEHALDGQAGERLVSDIELSDVNLGEGGGR